MNTEDEKKVNPENETWTGPRNSAKRKTLLICTILIIIVLAIAYKTTNDTTDNEVATTNKSSDKTVETNENNIFKSVESNPENYVSKDGLLFDIKSNQFYKNDGNDVAYVYQSDIEAATTQSQFLSLYIVTKNNDDAVTLTDKNNQEFKLSSTEYNNLLAKYINDETKITYPRMKDADFIELTYMAMMKMNEDPNIETSFVNTRYCAINGDYAVVICSPQHQDDDLHGYIFGKKDGLWTGLIPEYQLINNYEQYVNNNYGYMDIDLLLNMDINEYPKESFNTDLDGLVQGMKEANIISDSDLPMTYGVTCENLSYLEFASGLAFVGVYGENGAETYPVVNTYETKALFEKFSDNPPYIILKQY